MTKLGDIHSAADAVNFSFFVDKMKSKTPTLHHMTTMPAANRTWEMHSTQLSMTFTHSAFQQDIIVTSFTLYVTPTTR